MSSLFYRGNYIYIKYKPRQGGKTIVKALGLSVEKKTKKGGKFIFPHEAWELKKSIDAEVAFGVFGIKLAPKKTVSLSSLASEYIEHKQGVIAPASVREYDGAMKKLVLKIKDIPVADVTEKHLTQFRGDLLRQFSHNTAAKVLRHISTMFEYAVERDLCDKNHAKKLKLIQEAKEIVTFSVDELVRFFDVAKIENVDVYNQAMFLALTGFRVSDSCALLLSQIDLENAVIRLRNIKGKRNEVFPMDAVLETLFRGLNSKYDPFAFRYRKYYRFYEAYIEIRIKAKLRPELTPHSFKKTYSNSVYDAGGIDMLTMKELAHHSSIEVTNAAYLKRRQLETKREALKVSRKYLGLENIDGGQGT